MPRTRTLMAELPIPVNQKSANRALEFMRDNRDVFDLFLITDLPFGITSIDGLGLLDDISRLIEPSRLVLAVSAGHRDMNANLSRVYGAMYAGIRSFLVIQGTGRVTKASSLIEKLKSEPIRIGIPLSDFSEKGISLVMEKLKLKASFIVSQMYPDIQTIGNVMKGVEAEVFLTYPIFSRESTIARFRERGIIGPGKGLLGEDGDLAIKSAELAARGIAGYERVSGIKRPVSAYIIPLARSFDYSILRKRI